MALQGDHSRSPGRTHLVVLRFFQGKTPGARVSASRQNPAAQTAGVQSIGQSEDEKPRWIERTVRPTSKTRPAHAHQGLAAFLLIGRHDRQTQRMDAHSDVRT